MQRSLIGSRPLIATTALALVLVMALVAKAQPTSGRRLVCPPDDRSQPAPVQLRMGERKELVPPGATTLTVCRYNGMNAFGGAPQWGLRGAGASDDRAQIKRIVAELDALNQVHGTYNCPMDDDSEAVATFGYGSEPGVVVMVGTNGCNEITNGHVQRLGLDKPVVSQIEAVAKPVVGQKWAAVVGHLSLCGGPVAHRCYTENYDSGDRVVVSGSSGPWLAMTQVEHGRFSFQIAAPGTYSFDFYAGNMLVKKVQRTVTTGTTTHVVFLIPIR